MAENSKIEWTDHTFNPWIGCTKISPGCDHCYAETMMDKRLKVVEWGGNRKLTSPANWSKPMKWAEADSLKVYNAPRPRVFCASLADVFDNQVPYEWRDRLWRLIFGTPELDWLLLTKRPENIRRMLPLRWEHGWPNVWLGVTAEDQEHYNRRFGLLSKIPAKLWFISHEPALGPIDELYVDGHRPDWIIMGGESGNEARLMPVDWARDMRDLCAERGVPFFFKQMSGKTAIPADLMVREFPHGRV